VAATLSVIYLTGFIITWVLLMVGSRQGEREMIIINLGALGWPLVVGVGIVRLIHDGKEALSETI